MTQSVKNLPAIWETWVQSLGREDPMEEGMATPLQYSCLENPHGQKSLVGYSPWGHKGSDTTEQLSTTQHRNPTRLFSPDPSPELTRWVIPHSTTRGMQCDYPINVCPPHPNFVNSLVVSPLHAPLTCIFE